MSMGTVFQVPWTYLGEETKPETVRNLDPEEEKEPGTGIERNPDPGRRERAGNRDRTKLGAGRESRFRELAEAAS